MIQLAMLLSLQVVSPEVAGRDTLRMPSAIVAAARMSGQDSVRRRPRAIQVSEWYNRRLVIHRTLSYTTIPVFAAQYLAGRELYNNGSSAPEWAKVTHRVGATSLAGIFTVNTVTGLWNLWDSRMVSNNRALRTTHAVLMLAADAGFTYAGVKLSEDAERDVSKKQLHRTIALSALGVTAVSGVMMKFWNK